MTAPRPDPDELLERVHEEERKSTRGKLTIFFGAAPGVGKTFAMLQEAGWRRDVEGLDVVVGIVETHGRFDTATMLSDFRRLPLLEIVHRGVTLEEPDIDAALAQKPSLILIDELAHTNAEGSRHAKRWQDVEELLNAGIDVFTTLNVQHVESLNDVVAQITGVTVRETVPDSVLDLAHEIRVVDLPVEELLERLRAGKVYLPAQAERALEHFFKEGNLIALRELALRRTAERVDAQMRGYKALHGIEPTWHAGERVLVCVSASPHSARLVRAARRLATSLHAELLGVYVETPAALRMTQGARARLAANMRLVEQLGGDAITLRGDDAPAETIAYARKRNVTKIVLGKPTHPRWRDVVRTSFLDDVVRRSKEIDVYVISGEEGELAPARAQREKAAPVVELPRWPGYVAAATAVLVATVLSWFTFGRTELADVVMIYLLGVLLVAMRFGYGPSLVAAVLSVVAFDFFFVPPYYSFAVSDLRHVATFAVMFLVAVVISHLTKRVREQADSARKRESRTAALYAVSRELGLAQTRADVFDAAAKHLREAFPGKLAILAVDAHDELAIVLADPGTLADGDKDLAVAEWVWQNQRPAGRSTDTLPAARAFMVPLRGSIGRVGVLALFPDDATWLGDPEERHLLDAFMGLVGSAIERLDLAEKGRQARLQMETEQLRNALLSSVSHDLKTPLGVVTGATSALLDESAPKDEATRRELLETAHSEAIRLSRLVHNLLDMTRLEAGALKVKKERQPLEDIVGSALSRMEDRTQGRVVTARVPEDLPLVPIDPALIEQVLLNLLENATKYSPAGTPIDVSASGSAKDDSVTVEVADRGPGIAAENRERVFDKFYRVREGEGGGAGLGLAICRGIVNAHGGRIWVEPRPDGGALFRFTIPLEKEPVP